MTKERVHRGLSLASPVPKGQDVKALQVEINKAYRHFKIDRKISEDGEFGPQTLSGARQIGLIRGAGGKNRKLLRRGRVSGSVQRLIRGRKKTRKERVATIARKPYRRKLRKQYSRTGGIKALDWAVRQIGTTESPANSNWGPEISEWIKFTGYSFPVYWCGCFACYAVVKVGGAKIPNRIRIGYTGYITADANAGVNGLTAVPFSQARAGDIVVYNFEHIGLVERVDGNSLFAIEGNTSSGSSGSQSNGGGVYRRVRSRSDVVTIARPNY